jgi:hypothetical protein
MNPIVIDHMMTVMGNVALALLLIAVMIYALKLIITELVAFASSIMSHGANPGAVRETVEAEVVNVAAQAGDAFGSATAARVAEEVPDVAREAGQSFSEGFSLGLEAWCESSLLALKDWIVTKWFMILLSFVTFCIAAVGTVVMLVFFPKREKHADDERKIMLDYADLPEFLDAGEPFYYKGVKFDPQQDSFDDMRAQAEAVQLAADLHENIFPAMDEANTFSDTILMLISFVVMIACCIGIGAARKVHEAARAVAAAGASLIAFCRTGTNWLDITRVLRAGSQFNILRNLTKTQILIVALLAGILAAAAGFVATRSYVSPPKEKRVKETKRAGLRPLDPFEEISFLESVMENEQFERLRNGGSWADEDVNTLAETYAELRSDWEDELARKVDADDVEDYSPGASKSKSSRKGNKRVHETKTSSKTKKSAAKKAETKESKTKKETKKEESKPKAQVKVKVTLTGDLQHVYVDPTNNAEYLWVTGDKYIACPEKTVTLSETNQTFKFSNTTPEVRAPEVSVYLKAPTRVRHNGKVYYTPVETRKDIVRTEDDQKNSWWSRFQKSVQRFGYDEERVTESLNPSSGTFVAHYSKCIELHQVESGSNEKMVLKYKGLYYPLNIISESPTNASWGDARAYCALPDGCPSFKVTERNPSTVAISYPRDGQPAFSVGHSTKFTPHGEVLYNMSTAKGDSGLPVLDTSGRVVCLHNGHAPATESAFNGMGIKPADPTGSYTMRSVKPLAEQELETMRMSWVTPIKAVGHLFAHQVFQ